MIETFKITSGIYDEEVAKLFRMYANQGGREGMRGHAKKVMKKRVKLNLRKHFFTQSSRHLEQIA